MTSLWQINIVCHSSHLPFSFFKETGFSQAQPWQCLPSCMDPGRRWILNNIQHSWQPLQVPHSGLTNAYQIFQSLAHDVLLDVLKVFVYLNDILILFSVVSTECCKDYFSISCLLNPRSVFFHQTQSFHGFVLLPGRIIFLESRDAAAHPNHTTDLKWHSSRASLHLVSTSVENTDLKLHTSF